jgi:ubiquinone biosynthesis protein
MDILGLVRRQEQWARLRQIARVLSRYDLADWLKHIPRKEIRNLLVSSQTRELAERPWEQRVRLALTELGTTFIKLGQVLSTRPDLVGPVLAAELGALQAGTPHEPPDLVRLTVEAELGQPPERLFAKFEEAAFASASIGQVHRAILHSGQAVVVKVQRHGIQDKVRSDLELLGILADLIQQYVPSTRAYQPVATVREFRRTLLRELDFSSERRNLEEFARNFAGDQTVHFPVVYPALCGKRVLTMEMLLGVPGSEQDRLHQSGADLNLFARRAAQMYLHMIFRDGFYHADPHPGNYMLLPGDVVGVLDCGMVGRIDDQLRETFEELLVALLSRDGEALTDLLLRAGSAPAETNRVAFRADVSEFLAEFGSQSIKDFDLGGALDQMTEIIRRHHVLLPAGVALLLKTLVVLEGSARQLEPGFSLVEAMAPYQTQLLRDRFHPRRWLKKLRHVYRDIDRLVTSGPRDLAELLERMRSGQLEMRHEHRHLQAAVNRLVAAILAAALFLGSSLLCSHAFPPTIRGVSVVGVMGCSAALLLGAALLRLIIRGDD